MKEVSDVVVATTNERIFSSLSQFTAFSRSCDGWSFLGRWSLVSNSFRFSVFDCRLSAVRRRVRGFVRSFVGSFIYSWHTAVAADADADALRSSLFTFHFSLVALLWCGVDAVSCSRLFRACFGTLRCCGVAVA